MKQRLVCLTLALALIAALACPGAALAEQYMAVTGTQSLNLRQGPASNTLLLGSYPRGAWVTVLGESGNWYQVMTSDGKYGYMSKNYLAQSAEANVQVAYVHNPRATQFLNLREYPSMSSRVLRILFNGVPMPVLDTQDGWLHVDVNGIRGYVRGEYVTLGYAPYGIGVATVRSPNNSGVNLRQAPNYNATITGQVACDRYVTVLERGTGWYRVFVDGRMGFMNSDFLTDGLYATQDIAAQTGATGGGTRAGVVTNPKATQRLNLREQPNTGSAVLGRFANGVTVSILQQGTEWCQVCVDLTGQIGYMSTRYLRLRNCPQTPTVRVSHPQGGYVNLRATPSLTAGVKLRIPNGASLTVLAPGPDWNYVSYQGYTGYVVSYFVAR